MKTLVSTLGLSRSDWLKWRRKGIGGSDAGAILGMNSWSTPYRIWAEKLGMLPEQEDNEAMRQGRDLEEYVAQRFAEKTGKKVRRRNAMFMHDDYPWMLANIDRDIVGENAGLECKTSSSLNIKKYRLGEYPEQYYAQCQHYMAVMGWDKMYLAILLYGRDFLIFEIERDEEDIAVLITEEKNFWENYVEKKEAPPVDGKEPTSDTIKTIYEGGDQEEVQLFGRDLTIDTYLNILAKAKELEEEAERYKQLLQEDMGNSEVGYTDKYKVTWKTQTRKTFDHKKFAGDNPHIDLSSYFKESTFRKFAIKEM